MAMHPQLADLAGLIGTWEGPGHGSYPTIEDFQYTERVTFTTMGKPFFFYHQTTTDPQGAPLHTEAGYLRVTEAKEVEWMIAQPTGIVEIVLGPLQVSESAVRFSLRSHVVGVSPTAKLVDAVERSFALRGDILTYDMSMAAVGEPMTHHLSASLRRIG